MNIDNYFFSLATNVRKCFLHIGNHNEVVNSADHLIRLLRITGEIEKRAFADKYYEELLKVKFYLVSKRDANARRVHDILFTNLLKIGKTPPMRITKIFEEFVKGITYFSNETTNGEQPIYHRLASCGPRNDAFRNTFNQCTRSNKREKRILKEKIQTCFIERLIYDKLYTHQTLFFPASGNAQHTQDQGHVNWLAITKADFRRMFSQYRYKY